MHVLVLLAAFLVLTLVQGAALWLAAKLTSLEGGFLALLLVCFICNVIGLVPVLGGILSLVAYLALLKSATSADGWIDILLLVIVAWGLRFYAMLSLIPLLQGYLD